MIVGLFSSESGSPKAKKLARKEPATATGSDASKRPIPRPPPPPPSVLPPPMASSSGLPPPVALPRSDGSPAKKFICPSCGFRLHSATSSCDCQKEASPAPRGCDACACGKKKPVAGNSNVCAAGDHAATAVSAERLSEPHSACTRESLEKKFPHGVAWFAPTRISGHQICPCCNCCPCR